MSIGQGDVAVNSMDIHDKLECFEDTGHGGILKVAYGF